MSIPKLEQTIAISSPSWLGFSSLVTLVVAITFLLTSLFLNIYTPRLSVVFMTSILIALALAISLTSYSLTNSRLKHKLTERAFRDADCEFSSIFYNVLDGILIVGDEGDCLDANPAASVILGISLDKLVGQNIGRFLANEGAFAQRWEVFLKSKSDRGRAQLIAGDGRSLFVDFKAAANYLPGRHVVILCDVTERKQAEMKISEQLDLVDAAHAEAEALRKATLALSRNLAMDAVLDTLLECIFELVPFGRATVLFVEDDAQLMVAREAPRIISKRIGITLSASGNIFLQRILFEKQAVLLTDIANQSDWRDIQPLERFQSWLGIPLIAGGHVLGILSLGASTPFFFTSEHLRLAKSLAIPAAVAIQNARTHERAEIYAAELELRLEELRNTQKALQDVSREPSDTASPC